MYMVLVEIGLIGWAVVVALATFACWSVRPSTRRPSRTTLAVDIATALGPEEQEPAAPGPVTGTPDLDPADRSQTRGMIRVP